MSDADPYNWSQKKKVVNLFLVAFHAMMATFTAAAIMAAFVNIAEDLKIEVQTASYLTSLIIAIIGGAPLFWRPLSQRYGRRPSQFFTGPTVFLEFADQVSQFLLSRSSAV